MSLNRVLKRAQSPVLLSRSNPLVNPRHIPRLERQVRIERVRLQLHLLDLVGRGVLELDLHVVAADLQHGCRGRDAELALGTEDAPVHGRRALEGVARAQDEGHGHVVGVEGCRGGERAVQEERVLGRLGVLVRDHRSVGLDQFDEWTSVGQERVRGCECRAECWNRL
jgi:hypothetical protein